MGVFAGLLRRVGRQKAAAERPVLRALAAAAAKAVSDRLESRGERTSPGDVFENTEAIAQEIASDPVLVNNAGGEGIRESRVFSGGAWAAGGGLGVLLSQVGDFLQRFDGTPFLELWSQPGFTVQFIAMLFGTTAGGGGLFTMIGRWRSTLPPMTRKLWNPFSWLAPKK